MSSKVRKPDYVRTDRSSLIFSQWRVKDRGWCWSFERRVENMISFSFWEWESKLWNSMKMLGASEGTADINTKHTVIGNANLLSWIHVVEWDTSTFNIITLTSF